MKPSVYIETSIVSALAARPSRNLLLRARQQTSVAWWNQRASLHRVVISNFVSLEAAAGDPDAARRRLKLLEGIHVLSVDAETVRLAQAVAEGLELPSKARADAFHIASAARHGIELLLTWNCRHIANPVLRPRVERICARSGYNPPVICTPWELMENGR
jgi:predicted nucleic acid-binding protein